MNWIDSHCHLADPRLSSSLDDVLKRSREAGVTGWVQGGVSPEDWARQKTLSEIHGETFVTVYGLHPWWVAEGGNIDEGLKKLDERVDEAHALGETGLDFLPKFEGTEAQQTKAFEAQLVMAKSHDKPIVLHVVKAHEAALEILHKHAPFACGGLVHSFSSSLDIGTEYVKLGLFLSISSGAVRKGFQTLKDAIRYLPAEKLMVETDSPDQPPSPTGGLNEPANLLKIAKAVADLRGVTLEAVLSRSTQNARELFRI